MSSYLVFIYKNTFWWCFLERYQKTSHVQNDLFRRVSETYVALTYLELDPRYKETFFKKLADYLSIAVYTCFATSFPDSVLIQFNDEFKEFICEICHIWITGNLFIDYVLTKLDFIVLNFMSKKDANQHHAPF